MKISPVMSVTLAATFALAVLGCESKPEAAKPEAAKPAAAAAPASAAPAAPAKADPSGGW